MKAFLLILAISLDYMLVYSCLSNVNSVVLGVITLLLVAASCYPIYALIDELKD
jgi:hypothetical protein